MLSRWLRRLRIYWRLAKMERASPRQIGWAVGVGVLSGCTPALGFHGWVAVGAATLFRLNRLYAFLGSRISNIVILPWIVLLEVQLAHRVRTGAFLDVPRNQILAKAPECLADWCLGTLPVGGALGVVFGLGAFVWARVRRARRAKR